MKNLPNKTIKIMQKLIIIKTNIATDKIILNCHLKREHKSTTFLPIKELQRPTKIPYLTVERTKEDSDWIHDSINRADLISSI